MRSRNYLYISPNIGYTYENFYVCLLAGTRWHSDTLTPHHGAGRTAVWRRGGPGAVVHLVQQGARAPRAGHVQPPLLPGLPEALPQDRWPQARVHVPCLRHEPEDQDTGSAAVCGRQGQASQPPHPLQSRLWQGRQVAGLWVWCSGACCRKTYWRVVVNWSWRIFFFIFFLSWQVFLVRFCAKSLYMKHCLRAFSKHEMFAIVLQFKQLWTIVLGRFNALGLWHGQGYSSVSHLLTDCHVYSQVKYIQGPCVGFFYAVIHISVSWWLRLQWNAVTCTENWQNSISCTKIQCLDDTYY